MKQIDFHGCAYEDCPEEIMELEIELELHEQLNLGDMLSIEMMDDSIIEREIMVINPQRVGDYAPVSHKVEQWIKSGECSSSKKIKRSAVGPCVCKVVVMNVPYHEVKTDKEIERREALAVRERMVCITPYTEFHSGEESILNHTNPNYVVPDKVIAYLRSGEADMVCMGIYDHPFKPGTRLLGPYFYTDGHYFWDRDTWKYVLKYGLVLPEEFISHVMSEAGTHFIETRIDQSDQWSETIKEWKKKQGFLCFMPDNAGNIDLEDF